MKSEIPGHVLGICQRLQQSGFKAWIAGGAVRDWLLNQPGHDFDVATDAPPDQVMALFDQPKQVGAHFAVVLVKTEHGSVEVATFRRDGTYQDGRHPESVSLSTPEDDAARRDFTVNALFYDPAGDQVIDFVEGQADLKARLIRCVGDPQQRLAEDQLRLLRAIRFATTLDFSIEEQTWQAIKTFSPQIHKVSVERIKQELDKILLSPHRRRGLELLDQSGLLQEILPELTPMKGCTQPPQFHPEGDVFEHTLIAMDLLENPNIVQTWGLLLHDVGKPATRTETDRIRFHGHEVVSAKLTEQITDRLRFSNNEKQQILNIVRQHMKFTNFHQMKTSTRKRFYAQEGFDDLLAVFKADRGSSQPDDTTWQQCLEEKNEFEMEEALMPKPLLNGDDLKKLGIKPGRKMGKILEKIYDEQLEGHLHNKDEALQRAQELKR